MKEGKAAPRETELGDQDDDAVEGGFANNMYSDQVEPLTNWVTAEPEARSLPFCVVEEPMTPTASR